MTAFSLIITPSFHAGGGAEGGRYCRKYRDGEVDDFLPKFFFHGSG